jgi:hypothetical protein
MLVTVGTTVKSIIMTVIGLINMLIVVLTAAALVVFFIGLVRYIYEAGDAHGHKEGRERIIWGLITLFILFSLWGIINLLELTFFGSTTATPGFQGYSAGVPY